jgi:hypothetical protein
MIFFYEKLSKLPSISGDGMRICFRNKNKEIKFIIR